MTENSTYNIVLMGKTGTGKSTFGNYLFGENKFPKGTGKPVTTNGFHPISFKLNGLPITVYDSWGIEADKVDQWIKELNIELKKRDVTKEASAWFHTVFYCIQAGGHRIEPCDTEVINRFIREKYKVTVIFTKSDTASLDEIAALKETLQKECIEKVDTVEVCSEDKEMRGGNIVKAFGRDEVINNIFFNFWNSISIRLPERCLSVMKDEVKKWQNNQNCLIESKTGYLNVGDLEDEIRDDANLFFSELYKGELIVKEINKTIEMFAIFERFVGNLSLDTSDTNTLSNIKLLSRNWWFYFPTNILNFLIFGTGDNKGRLSKLVEELTNEMNTKIKKMLPEIKKIIEDLNPEVKKNKQLQLPK